MVAMAMERVGAFGGVWSFDIRPTDIPPARAPARQATPSPVALAAPTSNDASDRELLAALANGDQTAMGVLYDRYGALALGLATRIVRDRAVAEEVVQDAFVSAWRRATSYQPERGEPRAWLLSIVHHRAIDRIRGGDAPGRTEALDDAVLQTPGSADVWRETWRGLERAEIAAALAALPIDQRQAIELAFFGGLSHAEVADRTGQPLGTVKGRIRLGLLKLRGLLRQLDPASAN
jgi:RNA polymerase sigma-70 factor (ECF subfamily)